jgi:SAM-dependent methyltransferase
MSKMDHALMELQDSYDTVAEEYVARIFHELEHKPLDCELLDRFAANVRDSSPVCDLGCGPGHVARYLSERGVNVFGLDLSPRMIEQAQRLNPGIMFKQGNMLALEVDDDAWAGIVAFYSIIHIPRGQMIAALQELERVLRPQGLLLLSFHVGQEVIHRDEWWGKKVSLDFLLFERHEVEGYLKAAGFIIEEVIERPPYENVEYPSRRAYIFARKS